MRLKKYQYIILTALLSINPIHTFATTDSAITQNNASKSISYLKQANLNAEQRAQKLNQASLERSKTRLITALQNTHTAARTASFDYSIYDADTRLLNDDDYDGFYHRFSITIDADTMFDYAIVYADLYLSYEGGPWVYYASSQNYDIHADSFNDAFIIETELADGYPTGYYDVKIKLYDALTDEYLITYDHLDDASLYAIPLEDHYRDQYEEDYEPIETEIIITHGAGSIDLIALIILFTGIIIFRIMRIFNPSTKNKGL